MMNVKQLSRSVRVVSSDMDEEVLEVARRERAALFKRLWYRKNRAAILAKKKARRAANLEAIREKEREAARARDREARREYERRWYELNHDKRRPYLNERQRERRARLAATNPQQDGGRIIQLTYEIPRGKDGEGEGT